MLCQWAAYQLDDAVVVAGIAIENAIGEREEVTVGDRKEYKPKYTLGQILDNDFRLELTDDSADDGGMSGLVGIHGLVFDTVGG